MLQPVEKRKRIKIGACDSKVRTVKVNNREKTNLLSLEKFTSLKNKPRIISNGNKNFFKNVTTKENEVPIL